MLNVRLNKDTEKKLSDYSQREGLTKTSVVKEALVAYLKSSEIEQSPYALGEDLFGAAGSGDATASVSYKDQLKKKLREKHSH